jgi:hypothetical protein
MLSAIILFAGGFKERLKTSILPLAMLIKIIKLNYVEEYD